MTFQVKTENGKFFIIECQDGKYWIRDTTLEYLRDQILGKKCRQPKEEMPLQIYFDFDCTLYTSRIKQILTLS